MSFVVSPECHRLGLRAGAVIFRDLRVGPANVELQSENARGVAEVQQRFASPAAVRAAPEIVAFQELLRHVGVNPRREQGSTERLLLFALKRNGLPVINSLVDAYNLVSIRSLCSLGAHDLDKIALPVTLRLLTGAVAFTPLGSDRPASVNAGEYGYVDARGAVLCRLDVVQADFSKVTSATINALLIIESTAAHNPATVRQAFDDVIALVQRNCGGSAEIAALP